MYLVCSQAGLANRFRSYQNPKYSVGQMIDRQGALSPQGAAYDVYVSGMGLVSPSPYRAKAGQATLLNDSSRHCSQPAPAVNNDG